MRPTDMTDEQIYEMIGMCIYMADRCERDVKLDRMFMDAACLFLDEINSRKP